MKSADSKTIAFDMAELHRAGPARHRRRAALVQQTRNRYELIEMQRHSLIAFFGATGIFTAQLPASAQTFSWYRCHDGSEFIAAFYEGDTRAHLQLDGKAVTLPKRISVSGSRYAKGGITLRMTKDATTLKRGKRLTECKVKPPER
jgi:membrane-bound inhibitor of C-type lysozyme